MGTVYNRGSKHAPRWWVGYKQADGSWQYEASGQPTKELARRFLLQIESNIAAGRVGIEPKGEARTMGALFTEWEPTLSNRNASDDRVRIRRHLRPMFGSMLVRDCTLAVVMRWIDAMRAGTAPQGTTKRKARLLSSASQRHNLNLLSRFFAWAVERGHAQLNPVRQVPQGKRPTQTQKRDEPYLDDDGTVRALMAALPDPFQFMFYLGNRSGLRSGEILGLRISDLAFVDDGVIRVRHSYDDVLKEDKRREGKLKWAPAPDDLGELIKGHLERRRAAGGGPEDFLFVARDGGMVYKMALHRVWKEAAAACKVDLTWYQCTRHAFVSRNMAAGVPLDEISAAVGHSSPTVTRRYYDHFVRRSFSPALRAGLSAMSRDENPRRERPRRARQQ